MPLPFPQSRPQSALALTLEPTRLLVSPVGRDGAARPLLPPFLRGVALDFGADAVLESPHKAGAALQTALQTAGVRERRCVVCVPPSWALSASDEWPVPTSADGGAGASNGMGGMGGGSGMSEEDLRDYFSLRAEREFSANDLRLGWNRWFLPDNTGRATLAAIPPQRMEALEAFLAAAGCKPLSLSLAFPGCGAVAEPTLHLIAADGANDGADSGVANGSTNSANAPGGGAPLAGNLLGNGDDDAGSNVNSDANFEANPGASPGANVGAEPSSPVVSADGVPAALPAASLAASPAAQTNLVITTGGQVAAFRTLGGESLASPAFARELRITLGKLPAALRQNLRRARVAGLPPQVVPELRAALGRAGFGTIAEEGGNVSANNSHAAAERTPNILRGHAAPFEFYIPPVNPWAARLAWLQTRRGRRIVAGSAAALLAVALLFGWQGCVEGSLNAELARDADAVAELEALQPKLRKFRPWHGTAPEKLRVLETVIAAFPAGDIWCRSVQISSLYDKKEAAIPTGECRVNLSGYSRTSEALQSLQEELARQPGIVEVKRTRMQAQSNPIQFSLTFKWDPQNASAPAGGGKK